MVHGDCRNASITNKITGTGVVFLTGGGTILRRVMKKHERVVVRISDHPKCSCVCFRAQCFDASLHAKTLPFLSPSTAIWENFFSTPIKLDDHCLLAWSGSVSFMARGAFDRCCDWCYDGSGEGLFNFVVTGGKHGGTIYLESMCHERLLAAVGGS